MDSRLIPFAMADVPRYTSYPTAVQFNGDFPSGQADCWLAALSPSASLSIYVHIPFCRKLCWYCGCHTSVPNNYDRAERYVANLVQDIRRTASRVIGHHNRVRHLHFGGGTPTYLKDTNIAQILEVIDEVFGFAAGAEIALESDPRTLTRERAKTLASLGFNRISFGVQDFSIAVQMKINRLQPFGLVKAATEYLRQANFKSVNFDLMYGLPAQTVESVTHSAHLATQLVPDRIAVFGYAHVPWFAKHQRMIKDEELPGVNGRYAQVIAISETLGGHGYLPIGLDHFALPQDNLAIAAKNKTLRRNFQGYTDDASDALLAFGASAISEMPQGFFQASRDVLAWSGAMATRNSPVTRGRALTAEDKCRAAMIEQLMCQLTVDYAAVAGANGMKADRFAAVRHALEPMCDAGIVILKGTVITVPDRHRMFLRNVATAFDAYYTSTANRHARAV